MNSRYLSLGFMLYGLLCSSALHAEPAAAAASSHVAADRSLSKQQQEILRQAGVFNFVRPPHYLCQRSTQALKIDGKLDEKDWQNAPYSSEFGDILASKRAVLPGGNSRVKMLWDDNYLYVGGHISDKHVWATLKQHDSIIFNDPDFEVFIDAKGDCASYIEIEINALGSVWDLFLTKPYRQEGSQALHDWDVKGLKSAVFVDGTLNDPSDEDGGWYVEMAIPWRSINAHSTIPRRDEPPQPGRIMRMNFSHVDWQVQVDPASACGYSRLRDAQGNLLAESNHTWAAQSAVNIHEPELWGSVQFSSLPAGSPQGKLFAEGEVCRQMSMQLFKYQLARKNLGLEYAGSISELPPGLLQHCGYDYAAKDALQSYPGGFTFSLEDSANALRWSVDQSGVLQHKRLLAYKPEFMLWVHGSQAKDKLQAYRQRFAELKACGIDAVCIDGGVENIKALTPVALQQGLKVYAWLWSLNQPGNQHCLKHPQWYALSRSNKNTHDPAQRPYVQYYQFLCPNNSEVQDYLSSQFAEHAAIEGIEGVQIDYIRYVDAVLPQALWATYGLDMSKYLPDYDFCYCKNCLQAFERQHGRQPLEQAQLDAQWLDFRLAAIGKLVQKFPALADRHNVSLSAAVFPSPSLARKHVRQAWDLWPLDAANLMTYNSFYNQPAAWVAQALQESNKAVDGRMRLRGGMYVRDIKPQEFAAYLQLHAAQGVAGIGIFCDEDFSAEHMQVLQQWIKQQLPKLPQNTKTSAQ